MELSEFRKQAHQLADWMADYLERVEEFPVRSQVRPGETFDALPADAPGKGEPFERIFADFEKTILPGITHWQHPRFFAYFNANSSPPSVLGEMLTATLAAQCMLWETSPAATELEMKVTEWLKGLMDLPDDFEGSIQDSGSASNLCALIACREQATGASAAREGLAGSAPLIVYASEEAHSSVQKAARIAGIGDRNVRAIAVDENMAMKPDALAEAIREDRANGLIPAGIIACLGTTGTGAIDPIRAIGEIARAENLFLHIDGAWAGAAMILPEQRHLIDGIELADSFVFNPHKWLFTNFDCSVLYMRDPARLSEAMALTPAYLETQSTTAIPEYRNLGLGLGRRFRALKLWFVLRSYGAEKLRAMLRGHIGLSAYLAEKIDAHPDFIRPTQRNLALLTFRYAPTGLSDDADMDALNEKLLQRINDDGTIYLTKTRVNGRVAIRFTSGQTYTEQRHVDQAWVAIRETAASLSR